MFVGKIRKLEQHFVATIGGNQNNASGIGTVQWTWKDDSGKSHTFDVKNVLFFPSSPINILSVTELAEQLQDDAGTGITTVRMKSTFFWSGRKFSRTIIHPASNLPEMPINDGFSLSALWTRIVSRRVDCVKHHCHCTTASTIPDKDLRLPVVIPDDTVIDDIASKVIHPGE